MVWTIRQEMCTESESHVLIDSNGVQVARIIKKDETKWHVVFPTAPKLNWKRAYSFDMADGYVRGIEKAVQVFGKEIYNG